MAYVFQRPASIAIRFPARPWQRRRRMLGLGQDLADMASTVAAGAGPASTDLGPQYSWYCNSFLGQWLSPETCAIPTIPQQRAQQVAELATTSAPPAVQAAAVSAGDASVAAACAQNPADCIAQNAAGQYPLLSSLLGPQNVGGALGINPDGSQTLLSGWLPWVVVGVVFVLGVGLSGGRR